VIAAFVVLLREGFEASLLVAIVLAYLAQIGHRKERRQVWYGVGTAIAVSFVLAGLLFATVGELEGPAEKIFEACALFLAVGFLTYMVLWMRRESRTLEGNIRREVDATGAFGQFLGILVGWDPSPDLLEFSVWLIYLLVVGYAFFKPQGSAAGQGAQSA
jgi:high-affinity iron transporter